jgi:hypothetical protein
MKNEKAIEELLAEMLRKQDQYTAILNTHSSLLKRMLGVMEVNNSRLAQRITKPENMVYKKGA